MKGKNKKYLFNKLVLQRGLLKFTNSLGKEKES